MLRIKQSVCLQLGYRALPLQSHLAKRKTGVDADDGEAQPINCVVLDLRFYEYGHSDLERLTCLGLEIGHEQFFISCPAGSAHLSRFTLYEVKV